MDGGNLVNKGIYLVTNAEFENVLIPAESQGKLTWSKIRVSNCGVIVFVTHSDIEFHYMEKK